MMHQLKNALLSQHNEGVQWAPTQRRIKGPSLELKKLLGWEVKQEEVTSLELNLLLLRMTGMNENLHMSNTHVS